MQDKLKNELTSIIRSVVREELSSCNSVIRVDQSFQSDEKTEEIVQFVNVMESLGNGNLSMGIEVIRENHKWLYAQRKRSEKLSTAFFIILISTAATGIFAALWAGVKHLLGK